MRKDGRISTHEQHLAAIWISKQLQTCTRPASQVESNSLTCIPQKHRAHTTKYYQMNISIIGFYKIYRKGNNDFFLFCLTSKFTARNDHALP